MIFFCFVKDAGFQCLFYFVWMSAVIKDIDFCGLKSVKRLWIRKFDDMWYDARLEGCKLDIYKEL
jgi:hypothetical protein